MLNETSIQQQSTNPEKLSVISVKEILGEAEHILSMILAQERKTHKKLCNLTLL